MDGPLEQAHRFETGFLRTGVGSKAAEFKIVRRSDKLL
jgi:hypothetical protein